MHISPYEESVAPIDPEQRAELAARLDPDIGELAAAAALAAGARVAS